MSKGKKVTFVPASRAEFSAAARWYEERTRNAGRKFRAAVRDRLGLILLFPGLGEDIGDGCRMTLVDSYLYAIVYQATEDAILVVAVGHTSREPGHWRDRT